MSNQETNNRQRSGMVRLALISAVAMGPALAGSAPARAADTPDPAAIDAFINSTDYNMCDAKKIAKSWKVSFAQAKATIGTKILNNLENLVDQDIEKTTARCRWGDSGLTFEDAENLAVFWKQTVPEVKARVSRKMSTFDSFKNFKASYLSLATPK
jgi:hypothetical protein